jgi:hypothetical protein
VQNVPVFIFSFAQPGLAEQLRQDLGTHSFEHWEGLVEIQSKKLHRQLRVGQPFFLYFLQVQRDVWLYELVLVLEQHQLDEVSYSLFNFDPVLFQGQKEQSAGLIRYFKVTA